MSWMAYDNRGDLTQVVNALGDKIAITYDARNNPVNININGVEKQKNRFDGNKLQRRDEGMLYLRRRRERKNLYGQERV